MADPMNTGPGSLIITPTSTFDTLPKNEVSAPSLDTYNIYIRVVNVAEVSGKF